MSEENKKPGQSAESAGTRRPKGFAAMDRNRVREISAMGGKAAHAAGTAHQFTAEEAREAGKKGGVAPHVRRGGGRRIKVSDEKSSTPEGSK